MNSKDKTKIQFDVTKEQAEKLNQLVKSSDSSTKTQ